MITVRKSSERGHFNHGWLDTHHTFSFGEYHDRAHMGFGPLRVINEDVVAPGRGFDTHPHKDMEIVTWVLEGALQHRDSGGHSAVLRPGEAQRMSAGTGILHSEHNHSKSEPVHLLQIWIRPEVAGLAPGFEQRAFPIEERDGGIRTIASRDGRDAATGEPALTIHQDVRILVARLDRGAEATLDLGAGRRAWVQVARGELEVNGALLRRGDGGAVAEERALRLVGASGAPAEALVFDLP